MSCLLNFSPQFVLLVIITTYNKKVKIFPSNLELERKVSRFRDVASITVRMVFYCSRSIHPKRTGIILRFSTGRSVSPTLFVRPTPYFNNF